MKPHPRIRRTIKWGGLALCLLLAGVWVRSEWVMEGLVGVHWACGTCPGAVTVSRFDEMRAALPRGYSRSDYMAGRQSWPGFYSHSWVSTVLVPLWLPLAPTLLATSAAWHLDALARRRTRAGVCPKCHYDRTGLALSAVCPECGAPA